MVLSTAKALKAFHPSHESLLCMGSFISFQKSPFSSRLENTSKPAWSLDGYYTDLGLKDGVSLKFSDPSLRKFYLHRFLRENSSKPILSSGSFKVF